MPYASDIFYHGHLTYFLPTGFMPQEMKTVFEFPQYCRSRAIALPNIIWDMCKLYFENDIEANECVDILDPLRKEHITFALCVYPRNIEMINEAKEFINQHPSLLGIFERTEIDLKFAARELLSHVLYEVVLEKGIPGAVDYLRINSKKDNDLELLIAAAIMNRIQIFKSFESVLIYEHDWYPLIMEVNKFQNIKNGNDKSSDYNDSESIEFFRCRLFGEILNPIYDRCNSKSKNEKIGKIAKSKIQEILVLKEKCEVIAREIYLMPTREEEIKKKRMQELIQSEIAIPLSEITEMPLKKAKELLRDFLTDSSIIGGVLLIAQGETFTTLTTAAAARLISSGIRYIINNSNRKTTPSDLLVTGMKEMNMKYEDVKNHLNSIALEQMSFPKIS